MDDPNTVISRLMSDLQKDYGLTREQAAGVVGNFAHETGGFTKMQETGTSKGGLGYAQWTGARRTAFEDWAEGRKLDTSSYEANYGFFKHELATDRYERSRFNRVKSATTADEAARIVSKDFLRPGTEKLPSRLDWTSKVYGGDITTLGSSSAPTPAMPSLVTTSHQAANSAAQNVPAELSAYLSSYGAPQPAPASQRPGSAVSNYLGSAQVETPALSAIARATGQSPDVSRLPQSSASPAAQTSFTDDLVRNSTTPQNVDSALQTILDARYPSAKPLSPASVYGQGGPTQPNREQIGIAPTGRPELRNSDGSVSTELSITVTDPRLNNGQPTNLPTIWGGQRLNDDMAINTALASGQKFQSFPTIAAAERAAEYRSENEILTKEAPQSIIERAAARPRAPAPVVSASDRARGNVDVGAGLPQKLPGMSSWNDFYAGITPASAQSPVPASVEDRVTARNDALGASPRVAGVSDIGKPYSFKAVQETMNPRGTRSVVSSQTPVAKPSTSFAPPASPAPAYNAVTPAQREALSSVSVLDRLLPARLPDTPLTSSTLKPAQVATMGFGLGGAVDASGKRVTVPTPSPVSAYLSSSPVPATRKSPAVQAIADAAPPQSAPVAREPMGGPVSAYDAVMGPTPAARIDRPGFLPGVKLPGLLGAVQQFSKVLANASGPFNNGVDNALMQQMRGGNFTAPGAATGQAGGFLYAPKPGGGWVNVGRAPGGVPSTFSAGKPNAYDRMKASQSGHGGDSSPKSISG